MLRFIYETLDFSCGLLTAEGELAAMSEDFSGHVFAMALGLNATLEKFGDQIYPGDVLAVNDPYTGGTHLNDIAFYTPVFAGDRLLLFIGVRVHFADVGGATPGSFSGQDIEIYQEGMRILPVKLVEMGKLNQALWDVLFANMRGQEEREGDALAMLDTARVAEMRIGELCHKYGGDTIRQCLKVLLDSAEEPCVSACGELPDGECYYEQYMDNSGLSPEPLPIKGKLTVEGDSMTFDFTGSAPQVVGPMNCGLPVTQGGVFVVAKSWLDPKTPVNGGTSRPVRFVIPEGSCLAAQLPAAVGGCWEVYRQMESCVVGLISQIMPHEPGGETTGTTNHVYVAGYDPVRGRSYILYEYPMGGTPATVDTDGATGTFGYDCGEMACVYPAESAEQRQPLLIEGLEAQPGGEGAGFRRSGFGVIRRVRVLVEGSQLNVMSDRSRHPAVGRPGSAGRHCQLGHGAARRPGAGSVSATGQGQVVSAEAGRRSRYEGVCRRRRRRRTQPGAREGRQGRARGVCVHGASQGRPWCSLRERQPRPGAHGEAARKAAEPAVLSQGLWKRQRTSSTIEAVASASSAERRPPGSVLWTGTRWSTSATLPHRSGHGPG